MTRVVAAVPQGFSGQFFLSALAVNNSGQGGLQFLEGCYHMYDGDPETALQRFPGTVLSTGTEVRRSPCCRVASLSLLLSQIPTSRSPDLQIPSSS